MASNVLPLTIQGSALPPNVRWTPQQIADFIWEKARIVTSQSYALFVTGSTEPSSNVGPWLKDGTEWWVWNNDSGDYQPIAVPEESLGYFIGAVAPDPTVFRFWIETTVGGSPLALKIYYSGSWVDVYAAQLASYATITALNASAAATLAAANAYTNAAIAGIPSTSFYPAQGASGGTQSIAIDGASHKVTLGSAPINPSPSPFDTGNSRYVAPATGIYSVDVSTQFQNDTGVASGMEVAIGLFKNGVFVGNAMGDIDSTPSPNGSRWSPGFGGLVSLSAGDYIEVFATVNDGTNAGNIDIITAQLSVSKAG